LRGFGFEIGVGQMKQKDINIFAKHTKQVKLCCVVLCIIMQGEKTQARKYVAQNRTKVGRFYVELRWVQKRTSLTITSIKVEPHCMVLCKIMQGAKRQAQKYVDQSRTMLCDFM
jgi:hypothetical protein